MKTNGVESYLQYIQEGYLLSDKTISVNLHLFENRTKKKLLIIGVPGSGKTALLNYLLKKYNVDDFVSDASSPEILKGLKSSKRTIIEGMGLATLYLRNDFWKNLIIHQPMIIMGVSAIKAGLRADRRDGTVLGKVKDWKDLYISLRTNISDFQRTLNVLRKDVMKLPNVKIEEYKVPEFETVLY
jgi:GTPase SAR1 family protein